MKEYGVLANSCRRPFTTKQVLIFALSNIIKKPKDTLYEDSTIIDKNGNKTHFSRPIFSGHRKCKLKGVCMRA
jgi:hypothetical protein